MHVHVLSDRTYYYCYCCFHTINITITNIIINFILLITVPYSLCCVCVLYRTYSRWIFNWIHGKIIGPTAFLLACEALLDIKPKTKPNIILMIASEVRFTSEINALVLIYFIYLHIIIMCIHTMTNEKYNSDYDCYRMPYTKCFYKHVI